ncbi:MAG: 3-oxoacyl-[acyl-carrier-protein] synthase III C-terminal domain-containing protein [Polyangiaceae bacterium]
MQSSMCPVVRAVGRALPPNRVSQEAVTEALRGLWASRRSNLGRLDELHKSVQVESRYLALPLDQYPGLDSFEKRNQAWIRAAEEVAANATMRALGEAGMLPRDIDHVFFVSVTGIATPSIDARLANRLGFRADVKRTPIFGLGCVAGAAGLARAADYVRAYPHHNALLVSAELCSLTHQREDLSIANIIASGLFGDGGAAVIVGGASTLSDGPRVVATTSVLYRDTERVMGWDVVDGGFKIVLSSAVPALVRARLPGDVDAFLAANGLVRGDIKHWVAHTGGPKVLSAMEEALSLPSFALDRSRASLAKIGNLSSASVLFVLGDLLGSGEARTGDLGVLLAMGPGFCSELVLLRW